MEWLSGFIAGFAWGGLIVHGLTLWYWHNYFRGTVSKIFDKSDDSLMKGIAKAIPHFMRKGRNPPEE